MRRARLALSLAAALATSVTAIPTPYNYEQAPLAAVESPGFVFGHPGQRVNVSLYVMSRCPDAVSRRFSRRGHHRRRWSLGQAQTACRPTRAGTP